MLAGPSVFLSSGDGYFGELLKLQHGCEGPMFKREGVVCLKMPQLKRASSCLEGRTSWIFSSCAGYLSFYDRDLRDPLVWPLETPFSIRVVRVLSGFLSSWGRGLRPRVDSRLESEDSSPVWTWILQYFWSLHRAVRPRLEWGMHVCFPPEL